MRPLFEYKDTFSVLEDIRKEGLFEQRVSILARYDRVKKVEHAQGRITSFLEKEGQSSRTNLFKRLNLKRTGLDIAGEALNNLFANGFVYVAQGPALSQGGRRGTVLVWTGSQEAPASIPDCPVVRCAILGPHTHTISGPPANRPIAKEGEVSPVLYVDVEDIPEEFGAPTSLMPNAILEEVAASPSSEVKVSIGGTELKVSDIRKMKEQLSSTEVKVPQPTMKSALVSALTAGK